MVYNILGLLPEPATGNAGEDIAGELVELVLKMRHEAKEGKDYETSDRLRDELIRMGVTLKDRKDGTDWEIN